MPGGLYNQHFMSDWSDADVSLDYGRLLEGYPWMSKKLIRGVMPVDGKAGRKLLKKAQEQHEINKSPHFLSYSVTFKNEVNPAVGKSLNDIGLFHYLPILKKFKIPIAG